jgi:glyoxylase-like metal-dependent hydrolase (beta-lactamase superfamily II)
MSNLTPLGGRLYSVRVPIPYPMKFVNVLIDTAEGSSDPVTLVDCALDTPEARAGLEAGLTELGLGWDRIERVIVTHHHPDHYGLAGWIESHSGAQILMLDVDIERGVRFWTNWDAWIEGHVAHFLKHGLPTESADDARRESRNTRSRVHPTQNVTSLHEGDHISLANLDFEVLWLPGHADGHLGLRHAETRFLIAGDAILERITPNIGLWANSRPDPLGDYLNTLERIADLGVDRAVIGHYGPVLTDVRERALEIHAHHLMRLELCRRLDHPMSAYEASLMMFPRELPPSGRRFALVETLAHLEHLRLKGELQGGLEDGVFKFWKA